MTIMKQTFALLEFREYHGLRGGSTVGDAGDASPPPAMFVDLAKQR